MKERSNIKVKGGLLLFKIKMADAKFLKDMMGAISILVDEATFDLTPEGIKLRAMDPPQRYGCRACGPCSIPLIYARAAE